MSVQQKISDALKAAMVARDTERTGALRMVKSAFGYAQIERKCDVLPDADAIAVLQKEAKKRRDAFDEFQKGGRSELAAREAAELKVIEEFLPKPLSPDELESLVRDAIREAGATTRKDMGAVMKLAQARAGGRADGRALSAVVTRLLP